MRRYNGNTGRYEYIEDQRPGGVPPQKVRNQHDSGRSSPLGNGGGGKKHGNVRSTKSAGDADPAAQRQAHPSGDMLGGLQKTLSGLFSQGFENEDLLLFAVLFLMYQETHDKELLIIMGGMFLL